MYTKIYGTIDPKLLGNKSRRIYVSVNKKLYEAFPVYEEELLGEEKGEKKRGYSLNVAVKQVDDVEVIVETDIGFKSLRASGG